MASQSASSSSVPPPKKTIKFNEDGKLIGENKKELLKASRRLLKSHISVGYDDWGSVDYRRKNDIFEALQTEFDIPLEFKDSIFEMMSDQLRNLKSYIRSKYFGNLTAREIAELKDNPPNGIQMAHWNMFVQKEATELKMAERLQNAENRRKKHDVHLLGQNSYAEVSEKLKEQGIEHDRTYLYLYARTQKDGSIHPSVVGDVRRVQEIQNTEEGPMVTNVDNDPLAKCFGKDNKGRTRAVGKVSKLKYKGMQTVKKFINIKEVEKEDAATQRSEINRKLSEVLSRLDHIEGYSSTASTSSQSVPHIHVSTSRSFHSYNSTDIPASTTSSMHLFQIRSTRGSFDIIGVGSASPFPTPGEVVHGISMSETDRKINVTIVYADKDDEPLYLGTQAHATTIGEMVGNYVIWPIFLLNRIG